MILHYIVAMTVSYKQHAIFNPYTQYLVYPTPWIRRRYRVVCMAKRQLMRQGCRVVKAEEITG